MIGIVVVCTNMYFILALRFIKRFIHFYRGAKHIKFYMFTDTDPKPYFPTNKSNMKYSIEYIHTTHRSWVDATNSKFTNIIKLKDSPCQYLYYFDADTSLGEPFTEEWFIGDLVGGEHYNSRWDSSKPYDRNPRSTSYIPFNTPLKQTYYYGAFFGGRRDAVIKFCNVLIEKQLKDKEINYEPSVNDESYINNYFHYNPPTKTVPSDKFKFYVSCKGGFENTRNCSLDITEAKKAVLNNNSRLINFLNGKVVFV